MVYRAVPAVMIAVIAGCGSTVSEPGNDVDVSSEAPAPALNAPNQSSEAIDPEMRDRLPNDRNLVAEGPIDPRSPQAAGQVLERYGSLLEQGRFAEAYRLWSDGGGASGMSEAEFTRTLGKFAEIHAEIGAPGLMEGAAGSAYVDVPVRFEGRLRNGAAFNSNGTATLRRVNDVPGSTEEQRRWHIYRIDVQPPL